MNMQFVLRLRAFGCQSTYDANWKVLVKIKFFSKVGETITQNNEILLIPPRHLIFDPF